MRRQVSISNHKFRKKFILLGAVCLTSQTRSCKSSSPGLSSRHFFPPILIYTQCGNLQNSRFLLNLRKKDVSLKNKLLDATLITLFEQKNNNNN